MNGINAIGIRENDQLLEAKLTTGDSFIMLAARSGKAIRFHENATDLWVEMPQVLEVLE